MDKYEYIDSFLKGTLGRKQQNGKWFIKTFDHSTFLMTQTQDGTKISCCIIDDELLLWSFRRARSAINTGSVAIPNKWRGLPYAIKHDNWEQNNLDITKAKIVDRVYSEDCDFTSYLLDVDNRKVLLDSAIDAMKLADFLRVSISKRVKEKSIYLEAHNTRQVLIHGNPSTVKEARKALVPEQVLINGSGTTVNGLWLTTTKESPIPITQAIRDKAKWSPIKQLWGLPNTGNPYDNRMPVFDYKDRLSMTFTGPVASSRAIQWNAIEAAKVAAFNQAYDEWETAVKTILKNNGNHLVDGVVGLSLESGEAFADSNGNVCVNGDISIRSYPRGITELKLFSQFHVILFEKGTEL